jgi:hypothetical protein
LFHADGRTDRRSDRGRQTDITRLVVTFAILRRRIETLAVSESVFTVMYVVQRNRNVVRYVPLLETLQILRLCSVVDI